MIKKKNNCNEKHTYIKRYIHSQKLEAHIKYQIRQCSVIKSVKIPRKMDKVKLKYVTGI